MSAVDEIRFAIFDDTDEVLIDLREVLYVAALEPDQRVRGKEGYRTVIQFKGGQVYYLKREFSEFAEDLARIVAATQEPEVRSHD